MEVQGEELKTSGTSVEPQPESHVEAKSTKGKGKGKGRGKKSQPSNNESMVQNTSLTRYTRIFYFFLPNNFQRKLNHLQS